MVAGFRRSFSISPLSPSHQSKGPFPDKTYHVRSASLPCRSHPIISQLEEEIHGLRVWLQSLIPNSRTTSSWLCDGLSRMEHLLVSMDNLIQLPQSFRPSAAWMDRVVDDFLRLIDAHSSFRSAVLELKQHHSAAHVAIRRRDVDENSLASCLRSQRRAEKEMAKLAYSLRDVARPPVITLPGSMSGAGETELAGILREAVMVTASVSTALIQEVAAASSTASAVSASSSLRASWVTRKISSPYRKKEDSVDEEREAWRRRALESLKEIEACLELLETKRERVCRRLINTQVALLNIMNPSF